MYSSFSNVYPHTTTVVGHNRHVVVHTPVLGHRGVVPSLVTSTVRHRGVAPASVVVHSDVVVAPPVMAAHVIPPVLPPVLPSVLPSAPAHVALHNNLYTHSYETIPGEMYTCPTAGPAPRRKCSDYYAGQSYHCREHPKLKKAKRQAKKINKDLRNNPNTEDKAKDKCNKKGLTWIESKSKCKADVGPHVPKCTKVAKTHEDDYLTPHYMHPPSMYPSPMYPSPIYPPQTYPVAGMTGGNCVIVPRTNTTIQQHAAAGNDLTCQGDICVVCVGNHIS